MSNVDGRNPALSPLEVLVGEWEMALSNASFLPNRSDVIRGSVRLDWVQNGAFLLMQMGNRDLTPPAAAWLIGRDEGTESYTVLYYDDRNVSRVYEMSLSGGVWRMWRKAPGFWQRFEGTIAQDGSMITARWEKSSDGLEWEHDFDVTYKKVAMPEGG